MKNLIAVACCLVVSACGGGGGGGGSVSTIGGGGQATSPATFSLSGQAQKGPLIFGSRIWVSELDGNLNPNGKTYLAQTKDDLGNFVVSSTIGTNLVELVGMGYYMDELTGSLSTSPVTLSAIADLSVDSTPTINILTTLQAPRLKALMLQGKTYTQASTQSQAEVLAAFGVDSSKITSLNALYAMQINGTSDQDSALLAASAVLSKMASTAATTNGSSQAAEMTYLLSRIASDIQNGGSLTTTSIITARNAASITLDLSAIRTNVETYYASRGLTMTAPKFEEWIDKDGSGVLPRRLVPVAGLNFANVSTAESQQLLTSNSITVAGIGAGVSVPVSTNADTTIIKNGSAVPTRFTTAQDGDTIALRVKTAALGSGTNSTISVGSNSATWQVTTRTPAYIYGSWPFQWNNNFPAFGASGSQANAKYYAHPFVAGSTSAMKYLAIGTTSANRAGASTSLVSVSIYSNDNTNNVPQSPIATSSNFADYDFFGTSMMDPNGNLQPAVVFSTSGTSVFFGTSGVSLTQGTKYWVVMTFPAVGANEKNLSFDTTTPVSVDFGRRLASSDGVNWSDWGGSYVSQTPTRAIPLYMTN